MSATQRKNQPCCPQQPRWPTGKPKNSGGPAVSSRRPLEDWFLTPRTEPVGPRYCIEPHANSIAVVSIPAGIRAANRWARHHRPIEYTCNLRPGLPLWLFWSLHPLGIPIRGIVAPGQLRVHPTNSRHNATLAHVLDAWELCTWQEERPSLEERDAAVTGFGEPISMAAIVSGSLTPA